MTPKRSTLLHVFATFAVGGAQVRFAAIANHFGNAYRHRIIAMDGNLAARERLDPGLDVDFPTVDLRKRDTFGNLRRIHTALRTLAPDVLVTSNWGSIEWAIAARATRLRHLHVEDGFGPEERSRQLPRRVWTRRLVLRRDHVILPSKLLLSIARDVWRLDPRRLHYVPNGIDTARFAAMPPASPWPRDRPVIGTVAALRPEKNLARLVRAFATLDAGSARLVLVGDGPDGSMLRALADELGVGAHVLFPGHEPNPERALGNMDVFAITSDTEQMPLSLLEAMAAGLPVAATDVGDIRTMLPPDNHPYIASLADPAFADALRALISVRARWPAIGAASRARVASEYDRATMFRRWAEAFDGTGAFAT